MSTVAETIASTAAAVRERRSLARERYWALARAAGLGQEVDPDAVVDACEAAGEPLDAFQRAAEMVARRTELARLHAACPGMVRTAAELDARQVAMKKDLEEHIKRTTEELKKLRHEAVAFEADIPRAQRARGELVLGCPYPALQARYAAKLAERMEAQRRVERLQERRTGLQLYIKKFEQVERPSREYAEQAAGARRDLADVEEQILEARAAVAALTAEVDAVERDMLEP